MSTQPQASTTPLNLPASSASFALGCEKGFIDPITREATPEGQRALWLRELATILPLQNIADRDELIEALAAEINIAVSRTAIRVHADVQRAMVTDDDEEIS